MKPLPLLLCAAAGLAGWWGASWGEGSGRTGQTSPTRPTEAPSAAAPGKSTARNPHTGEPHGSTGLAGLPAQLGAIGYDKAVDLVFDLPEGPARAVALALLEVRGEPGDDPFADPLGNPTAAKEENPLAVLAQKLTTGAPLRDDPGDAALLRDWAQRDPAAACAAILQAPPGEFRAIAADEVAVALAKLDPARALDLVLQVSGDQLDRGAARAWAELTRRTAAEVQDGKNAAWYLQQMSGAQQDSLFRALSEEMSGPGRFSDVPESGGAFGSSQASHLELIADAVLQAKQCGPGMEAFLQELAKHPETASGVYWKLQEFSSPIGSGERAAQILEAESLARVSSTEDVETLMTAFGQHDIPLPDRAAVLSRTAPRLLPNLCRSGHVEEAVKLLGRIEDRTVWRESFEAMLPAWMDADPAKARAAFEQAPLTALERERWERHPAFLLHP